MDPTQEGPLVPPGVIQACTARWRRPMAVSSSPHARGLTDRFNDTVGVTARLQLIFECDWSLQWVAFHQCWADKRDLFSVVFVYVCSLCVCTCTPAALRRCTREKKRFMVVIRAVAESHVPRDDEFCMGLSPVCTPLVYSIPYIYTLMYLSLHK